MEMLFSFFLFSLCFAFVVGFHEFGHFLSARKFGIGVPRFAIGFGPIIGKIVLSGTEFSLRVLPLGGYVELLGDSISREFAELSVEQLLNDPGLDPAVKDKIRATGESGWFVNQSGWKQLCVDLAGPLASALLALPLSLLLLMGQGQFTPVLPLTVGQVQSIHQSDSGGRITTESEELMVGDQLISINGHPISSVEDYFKEIVHLNPGEPVMVVVNREGIATDVTIVPGEEVTTEGLGIKLNSHLRKVTLEEAIPLSVTETLAGIKLQAYAITELFSGHLGVRGLSGPIGIFKAGQESAQLGSWPLVNFIRTLTEGLALLNILPLPVLDGGRSLFAVWKIITGQQVNGVVYYYLTVVGAMFLVSLAIFATVIDLGRLV